MASTIHLCVLFTFLLFVSPSIAKTSFKPRALLLPVTKDPFTNQYYTYISQRTPLVSVKLTVDIGGEALWVDCEGGRYVSSSYKPVHCSTKNSCSAGYCFDCFAPPSPGCNNNTCRIVARNQLTERISNVEVTEDVLSILSTDGSKSGPILLVPRFQFGCAERYVVEDLGEGVEGMAGLGRSNVGLPSQLASAFKLRKKFAICLSPSSRASGAIFFGDGPYVMRPNVDVSKSLTYTPLLKKRFVSSPNAGDPPSQYFIGVQSIKVNGKVVPINTTLLSINDYGKGGTQISTIHPYTVLETTINNAITNAFAKELQHIPRMKPTPPYRVCYDASKFNHTRVGPAVPPIDFVLNKQNVYWRIVGANALVQDGPGRLCLAFVDGGSDPDASIVIGGHQLENHLLQFDLDKSRVGFSSSLLSQGTMCANFNFTSIP